MSGIKPSSLLENHHLLKVDVLLQKKKNYGVKKNKLVLQEHSEKKAMPFTGHAFLTAFPMIVTSSYQDKTGNLVSVTVQIPYRYEKVRQQFFVHFPA